MAAIARALAVIGALGTTIIGGHGSGLSIRGAGIAPGRRWPSLSDVHSECGNRPAVPQGLRPGRGLLDSENRPAALIIMSDPRPTGARLDSTSTRLLVSWVDGTTLSYPIDVLRAACPCAGCVDEWTGRVMVSVEMFPNVRLKGLKQVGQYAFNIAFSDGHDTGLYTYPRLLTLGQPFDEARPAT